MNPALIIKFAAISSVKKQVGVVFASLVVVLTLPLAAVGAMGSDVLTFLSDAPSAEAAATQGFYTGPPITGDTYTWGNCTYWAFAQRLWANKPIPTWWGNANTWDDNARREGYEVNHTPAATAVFQTDDGDWGHVAYVTEVKPDGTWTISEMNAPHLNVVSTRTFAASAAAHYTFIHDKKGSS
ncbi:CHAP domain-containing protein [Candidatus Saccharibacteria bacterium]|nr:CHAP domain-containing protein [Candidatus Saccharibacteria bacterium]